MFSKQDSTGGGYYGERAPKRRNESRTNDAVFWRTVSAQKDSASTGVNCGRRSGVLASGMVCRESWGRTSVRRPLLFTLEKKKHAGELFSHTHHT